MKIVTIIFLLLTYMSAYSQESRYVLFDADHLHSPVKTGNFQLYYNQAEIRSKSVADLTLNIYDLYFARHDFKIYPTDQQGFRKALEDYSRMENDILVALTPLYDHDMERQPIDVTDSVRSGKITFIAYPRLLQEAIRNLYRVSFPDDNLCNDSLVPSYGRTKRLDMKLVIKIKERYYHVNNYTLTEFYYISRSPVTFPNELTFGGINLPVSVSYSNYFKPSDISVLIRQFGGRQAAVWEHFKKEVFGRIYCAGTDSKSIHNIELFDFWTTGTDITQKFYRLRWPGEPFPVRNGSNLFQFVERIGLVNGNYDFFLNKLLRNIKTEPDTPDTLNYHFAIEKINNKPLSDFTKWYEKKYVSKNIQFTE